MKKVAIIGSNGLLGQSLVRRFNTNYEVIAVSRGDTNLSKECSNYHKVNMIDRAEVSDFFSKNKPEVIINSAAYTNVDGSEKNKEICWNTNVRAVENIIDSVEKFNPILVQISSDYVFNGQKGWYTELDEPDPNGTYARSKYAAENIIANSKMEYIIARTQVLYGYGNKITLNFVTWVVSKLQNNEKIKVVFDQVGNPTFTDDFCESLYRLLDQKEYGLFHISGNEVINRYEFALKIAEVFSLDSSLIEKTTTSELRQEAPRPLNSSFVIDKLINRIDWEPEDLLSGLKRLKILMND